MTEPTVKVDCRFDLTDVEIAVAARKRAAFETDLAKLEAAFGVEKEKHKTAASKLESSANALAELIRKGYELRPTECRHDWDYAEKEVRTVRLDTGEVVKSRRMTDLEVGKGPALPLGPAVLLSDTDPDVVAAKAAEEAATEPKQPDTQGAMPEGEATDDPSRAPGATPSDPAPAVEGAGEAAPELPPAEAAPALGCSVCKCAAFAPSTQYGGEICRTCGHKAEYHQGRSVTPDPLGLEQKGEAGHAAS